MASACMVRGAAQPSPSCRGGERTRLRWSGEIVGDARIEAKRRAPRPAARSAAIGEGLQSCAPVPRGDDSPLVLVGLPRAGIIGGPSMQVAVGKDVEAACRKCGEVWHVIVAVEGGKITKVQCKECMAYHRYRPPEGEERVDTEPKPKKVVTTRRPSSPRKTTGTAAAGKGSSKKAAHDEPLVEPDLSRPIRLYKMTESYAPGDRVEHPKFGQGVVELLSGPGKMTVFFEDGRRTLAHHR
jgi:hypothetical protein